MADLICSSCDLISDQTYQNLVASGRIPVNAKRRPRAVCFLRNETQGDGSRLDPVCGFHRGGCVLTVVSLEEGMGEYSVQEVMGS